MIVEIVGLPRLFVSSTLKKLKEGLRDLWFVTQLKHTLAILSSLAVQIPRSSNSQKIEKDTWYNTIAKKYRKKLLIYIVIGPQSG